MEHMPTLTTDPASIIRQHPSEGTDDGSRVIPQGGGDHLSSTTPPPPMMDDECRIVSSADMLARCRANLSGTTSDLWGAHIRASTVTLFIGETSAGKTVFLHNLAYHLAEGDEFLGLKPPHPLRVLSVDFESYEEIMTENLSAIGTAPGWDFFDLTDVEPGPKLIDRLQKTVSSGGYDIVIVDPLMEAYPVKDENDNALAIKQMLVFRKLARSTRAAVVVVHNSGQRKKRQGNDKFLGRGATARVDRADVSINFTAKNATEREVYVTKSRSGNLNERIAVRFSGELGYELIDASGPSQSAVAQLQVDTAKFVRDQAEQGKGLVERKTLLDHFKVQEGTKESVALDRALRKNVVTGALQKPKKGVYALPTTREVVNIAN